MKKRVALKCILLVAVAGWLAGCVTHRIDWNTRVGAYTFDQAVTEFGPPDKQAKLTDGRLVAEWITRYAGGTSVMIDGGFYGRPGGMGFVQTAGPGYYESKLRLTFGTNSVLSAWSKN